MGKLRDMGKALGLERGKLGVWDVVCGKGRKGSEEKGSVAAKSVAREMATEERLCGRV